jgi:hypothetical protein
VTISDLADFLNIDLPRPHVEEIIPIFFKSRKFCRLKFRIASKPFVDKRKSLYLMELWGWAFPFNNFLQLFLQYSEVLFSSVLKNPFTNKRDKATIVQNNIFLAPFFEKENFNFKK